MERISPKYIVTLTKQINTELRNLFSVSEICSYLEHWIVWYDDFNRNFDIQLYDNGVINIEKTLNEIDDETLLKIAIDLEIETPDFIPCIPTFKNEIKTSYKTASRTFELACKKVESEPDIADSLANAALESIIKEILKDERLIDNQYNEKDTLYKLTEKCLKKLNLFPSVKIPDEIKRIGSGLLTSSQAIEDIRSDKTLVAHGKTEGDFVIDESALAFFIVNAVTTIGLFLIKQYQKQYPIAEENTETELPF